jgi:lipoate-protein ligase A
MRSILLSCLEPAVAGPAEQLRIDEDLLMEGKGVMRLWETAQECVVLGQAGKPERDVHMDACRWAGIPILRRCSGGGAVLLGPGCLNYSLVLPLAWETRWRDVRYSLAWAMGRMSQALGVPDLRLAGDSDLVLRGKKVSGNAQRRTQHAILHHGTLLHDFDGARVEQFLKPPHREPGYRDGRAHGDFLGNLPLTAQQIKHRLMEAWC